MRTLEAIAKRKSTRSYKAKQIDEDALEIIIKAGDFKAWKDDITPRLMQRM